MATQAALDGASDDRQIAKTNGHRSVVTMRR
jgi:hypothetical protein